MDEIKGTPQDSLQKPGQASTGAEETTSEKEAKTYTEDEVNKRVNDALAAKGRDAKTLTDREATVQAREDANKAEQDRRDVAELAEAQKDPDQLAAYQARKVEENRAKSLTEREANLARDKAEHEAEVKAAKDTQMEVKIWEIAAEHGVDPVELKDTMKDLNLTTVEQAKAAAKRLNKKPQDETLKKKTTHDSLVTSGGPTLPESAKEKMKAGFDEKHK